MVYTNGRPHEGAERDARGLPPRFKPFVTTALANGCKPKQILNSLRLEIKEGRLEGPAPILAVLQQCSKTHGSKVGPAWSFFDALLLRCRAPRTCRAAERSLTASQLATARALDSVSDLQEWGAERMLSAAAEVIYPASCCAPAS
jgi:hypothetical protein